MELKANELRIGNWILDEDKEENQIEHLQPIYGYAYRWEWLKYYKPIPLTEDWLIKFGFIFESEDEGYIDFSDNYRLFINKCNAENKTYLEYHDGGIMYLPNIKHVHQLQNLYFALTQKELTF